MRTVTRAEAASGASIPYTTLITGRYHGDREPAVPADKHTGRGKERWSVPQVLACRLAKIAELRFGTALPAMADLFNCYWAASEEDLRRQFRAGRKYLIVVGATPVAKVLFTRDEIENTELINKKLAAEHGLPLPASIDVAAEYDRLCAALMLAELNDETQNSQPQ